MLVLSCEHCQKLLLSQLSFYATACTHMPSTEQPRTLHLLCPNGCSFAMTERFVVFIVWPALLSVLKLALVGSPAPALSWHSQKGAKIYVIDRRKGGPGHVATYRCLEAAAAGACSWCPNSPENPNL